jgi:hypothetical protein
VKYILSKPTQLNGKEYTEIDMDIESLIGDDICELEAGFRTLYRGDGASMIPDMDSRYLVMVAGRCAKINPKDLGQLGAQDFKALCTNVRNFLLERV